MLLRAKQVAGMQHPSARDWRSVKNWVVNHAPLVDEEQAFIWRKEDLVTLRSGREGAGFEGVVEQMLSHTDNFLSEHLHCHVVKVCLPQQ